MGESHSKKRLHMQSPKTKLEQNLCIAVFTFVILLSQIEKVGYFHKERKDDKLTVHNLMACCCQIYSHAYVEIYEDDEVDTACEWIEDDVTGTCQSRPGSFQASG